MPGIDYGAARTSIRLADVLDLINYQPRPRFGDQVRGPCPLHGSSSPTRRVFAAHLGKNGYHCFRGGASGNALDLWVALTGQKLHAAVLDLCQRLHRPVSWLATRPRTTAPRPAPTPTITPLESTTMPEP